MKRYYLGVMMLALGAAGVVWVAIEQRAPATAVVAAPPPTTVVSSALPAPAPAPPPTPSLVAMQEPQVADAGHLEAADQTFPPLAADAAWNVVGWTMSAADVERALREAGVVVVDATDTKTGAKRLRAKSGPWDATIDFGAKSPEQIVVTTTNLSKEGAQAIVSKMKERAPATKTIDRAERRWKKDGGAVASLLTHVEGATATMREEHVRESAPGGWLGFAGLRWGMSTQEVVGQLTPRGYAASVVKAPATGHAETMPFTKGDVEGTASFNQFGLRQLEISGPTTDSGAARAKELQSSLGKPAWVELSTKTEHVDHAHMTSIEVEVTERQPGDGFTVVETYRPRK